MAAPRVEFGEAAGLLGKSVMLISVQSTTSALGILKLVVWADEFVSAVLGGELGADRRRDSGVELGVAMSVLREIVVQVKALWSG